MLNNIPIQDATTLAILLPRELNDVHQRHEDST